MILHRPFQMRVLREEVASINAAPQGKDLFQNDKENTTKTFTKLKILAASDELDLAILEFPNDERPFSNGINFYQGDLEDGEQIFTAGYPGLMGTPVWQFGTGHITIRRRITSIIRLGIG